MSSINIDKIRNILFNENIEEIEEVEDIEDSNMGLKESNDNNIEEISRDSSITYLDLYLNTIYNS